MSADLINYFKRFDYSFFVTAAGIFVVGLINLYSATYADGSNLFQKQIIWFFLSMVIGFLVSFLSPKIFFRLGYWIYGINLFLLGVVLAFGHKGMGAQRWLDFGFMKFQPSEVMKISLVLALAKWFSKNEPHRRVEFSDLWMPLLITLIPAILIIKQPDLGTGLLLILLFAIIVFYRGIKVKLMLWLCLFAAITGVLMYHFQLKEYQKKRILTFINPTSDAKGSGYNAIQSEIAIGSGQIFGKGFKKSTQASLSYLPENHTDFVFSVFNEEHGLLGALILISLYLVLFIRIIWLSTQVLRIFDSLLVIGLMSVFFLHTFINMAMVMGLMPIVGIPLPLFSYGGSSLITFGVCLGMISSISNARNLF